MPVDSFEDGQGFERDDAKNRSNIVQHGLDFVDAREVFSDPARDTFRSVRPGTETRYVTVGMVRGLLIAVVATRRDDKIRIISARAARAAERARYG